MNYKGIVCFIYIVTLVLSLTGCGTEARSSDSAEDTGLPDLPALETKLPSSTPYQGETKPHFPEDYPADLMPVMDGAENIEVLPGMNYTFCSYSIHEMLENIASFHNKLFASELNFADTSTDEVFCITFSKDGNGTTVTAEPDTSKDSYILVSVTIAQDQRS